MIEYCQGCKKKHADSNWNGTYEKEIKSVIYVCSKYFRPTATEHVPESMRQDREQNVKSMLQPWREGEPSAEFIEAYPKQAEKMFSTKERIKAKEVWKDTPNIKNWKKTK